MTTTEGDVWDRLAQHDAERRRQEEPRVAYNPADLEPRPEMTAEQFRQDFIAKHSGGLPVVEIGYGEYLLADGTRISQRGAVPVYHDVPSHPYDVWRFRFQYAMTQLAVYKEAIRHLEHIVGTGEASYRTASTPEFRWNVDRLGEMPRVATTGPQHALTILRLRRDKLQRMLDKLNADPVAEVVRPLLHVNPLGAGRSTF